MMRNFKPVTDLKTNPRAPFKKEAASTTMNESNQSSVVSESERVQYLASLQAVTTRTMIPAMVLLILLSVTGLVGNSLVLFVYTRRFTKTSTRVFVLAIAAFDLVANVIGIPGEIFDMFHIWDFDNPPLCRARLFFNAFSTLSSAMVLLAVAVTRYRKVCFPYGWQTSIKQARIASLVVALLGVLFSLPYVILNGRQTKKTPRPDIFGSECTTDDSYMNTVWPLLNNGFFVTLFLVCCIPFTVLYVKIGVQAWRHSIHHGARGVHNTASYIANSSSAGIVQNGINTINSPQTGTDQGGTRGQSEAVARDSSEDFWNVENVLERLEGNGSKGCDRYDVVIAGGSVEVGSVIVDEFIAQLKTAAKSRSKEALNGVKVIGVSTVERKLADSAESDEVGHRKGSLADAQTSDTGQSRGQTTVSSHLDGNRKSTDVSPDGAKGMDNLGFVEDDGSRPIIFLNPTFACVDVSHPNTTSLVPNPQSSDVSDSNTTHQPTPVLTPNSSPQIRHPVVDHEITKNRERLYPSSGDTVVFNTQTPLNDTDSPLPCSHQENQTKNVHPKQMDEIETSAETPSWVDVVILPRARTDLDQSENDVNSLQNLTQVSLRISCTNTILQKNEWLRTLVAGSPMRDMSKSEQTSAVPPDPTRSNELYTGDGKLLSLNEKVEVRQRTKTDQKAPRNSKDVMSRIKSAVLNTRNLQRFSNRPVSANGRRPLGRTTAMLIAISAVYIVGFVPYLILVFYRLMCPDQYSNMTMGEEATYNFFLRTYFLNCAANPIIYGVCDKNFRRECISLLKC